VQLYINCKFVLAVLVKFEDNVQLWITKLRDLTYLDDEPVKSWKLEKGIEVTIAVSS